jgi:DNA-binding FadR family transcriptional regulator
MVAPYAEQSAEDLRSPTFLRPVQKVRAWQQIALQIENDILEGRLRAGDRLPGERQMSEMLGVGRGSVREALRLLEAFELVTIRAGNSPQSGAVIVREPGDAISTLLRLHVALRHFTMADVVQTRQVIEVWAAQQAAERRDETSLASLREILERMSDPSLDADAFLGLDTEFHVSVADASGNALVSYLMQGLRDAIKRNMTLAFREHADEPMLFEQLRREHLELYDAIAAGQSDVAGKIVAEHIHSFYSRTMQSRDES